MSEPEQMDDSLAPPKAPDLLAGLEHEQRRRQVAAALFGGLVEPVRIGRYRLAQQLGEGGMGTVFAGTDESGAAIAIKVMRAGERDAWRFDREVGILSILEHPRIIRYIDHGTTADGRVYLVMERLEGQDLRTYLDRNHPSILECITLGIDVADGLMSAHQHECVHRDIKPSNLFLVDGAMDRAKILDFGLARAREIMPSATNTGAVLGTIGYMAPEQARGDSNLDHRADIFSLGCVLYEALTGQAPFMGDNAVAILAKILLDDPRPIRSWRPDVPARLAAVIHSMLAKRAEDRPASARDVMASLRACAADLSPESPALSVQAVVSFREQRASCLLLVADELLLLDAHGPTAIYEQANRSRPAAAAYGASSITLLDGSEILVFEIAGHVSEVAAQAARCGLFIRSQQPRARQALCVGKTEHSGNSIVGRVIDQVTGLLRIATPGAIVLEDSTARLLQPSFDIEALEGHARLVAEHDDPTLHMFLGKPSPFVGRAREQGWLTGLFNLVLEEARSAAALIVAPPGMGKSRLWREFTQGLARAGHDPLILAIRCTAALQDSPLAVLGAALLREAGVTGSDSPERVRERLRDRYAAPDGKGDTSSFARAAFITAICSILPEGGDDLSLARRDPAALADAPRLAWLDWLRSEAQQRALILVVEDLHWCDEMTAVFVRAAVRDLADRSLLVIATARPSVTERFDLPWPTPESEVLHLAPIAARASEVLVRQTLGPVETLVIESVVARAEGNPFFLEELIRASQLGPSWMIPDTVLSVVQARLLRLGDEQRRLLRAASVFDIGFAAQGVARLLGASMREVTQLVDLLVDEEVLTREPGVEGSYRFRHALMHDAAYAMLSEDDRCSAHRAAAQWLEIAGGDAAEIAAHFARGNDARSAGEWWVRAARRGMMCSDLKATASYVERALECGVDGELLAESRFVQAEVAMWSGDVAGADLRARESLMLAMPGSAIWLSAIRRAINCAYVAVRMDDARALIAELKPFRGGRSGAMLFCIAEATYVLSVSGAIAEARALAKDFEQVLGDASLPPLVRASMYHARAALAHHDQRPWSGIRDLEQAIACYEQGGDIRTASRARATLGWVLISLGAPGHAERCTREGLPAAHRLGSDYATLYLEGILSWSLLKQRPSDEARALLRRTTERAKTAGDRRLSGYVELFRALAEAESMPSEQTIAAIRSALVGLEPFPSTHLLGRASLAVMLARRGELAEAMELTRSGLATLRHNSHFLDDEFSMWSDFVEVLDRGGAHEQADLANAEAMCRVDRLASEIQDASIRQSLLAYEPVVRLVQRAHRRESGDAWP
jgi:tetratricopeptide (TPR) repeat protein